MGRLVQHPPPARTDRQRASRRSRSALLCSGRGASLGRLSQTKWPPGNPARFTPWCAGFVGGVLEEAGIKSGRSAAARSYVNWGQRLAKPVVGCIVVLERGPGHGHVFFLLGRDTRGNLVGLGGNQGNRVSVASFDLKRVLAMVWLTAVAVLPPILPVLASNGAALSPNEA
ncbi:hypothetical protein C0214_07050 [Methylobacterium sp. DM1]|nr:hypothetical protein C0214_07050 [Methylobacterium sp. DM1]